jgi:formylglycine-generating enzyme required for sulfatase activity
VVLTLTPVDAKSRFFDCYRGVEILARKRAAPGQLPRSLAELGGHAGRVQLSALAPGGERADAANAVDLELQIEAGGFGCVVETDGAAGIPLTKFLTQMRTITQTPLSAFSSTWTRLPQTMVPMGKTARVTAAPAGMVRVPVSHNWEFNVRGVEIEGGDDFGTDVQFPWEKEPMGRSVHGHRHTFAKLGPFYIDRHPVTNAKYSAYLAATRYAPADPVSWLRHWNGSATPPPAIADAPVVCANTATQNPVLRSLTKYTAEAGS